MTNLTYTQVMNLLPEAWEEFLNELYNWSDLKKENTFKTTCDSGAFERCQFSLDRDGNLSLTTPSGELWAWDSLAEVWDKS